MPLKLLAQQRWKGAGLSAVFAIVLGVLFWRGAGGESLIRASYDIPFALRNVPIPTDAVLVYLDDFSHGVMDQPLNQPWDRSLHATLIDRLTEDGAAAVVFDIIFSDPAPAGTNGGGSADATFAGAIKANGKVILGGLVTYQDNVTTIDAPFRPLQEVAAGWGLAQFRDEILGPRQHLETVEGLPSLAWAAATLMEAPATRTGTQDSEQRWINYYGRPGSLPFVSYSKAYYGDELPKGFFQGKVVVVGSQQSAGFTGTGKDEFPTPFTWLTGTSAPGAEIHATVLLNLLRQDWLTRMPKAIELVLVLLLGLGAGFGLSVLHSRMATLAALGLGLLVMAMAWLLFRYQLVWFTWLILLVQILFGLIWSWGYNSIQSYIVRTMLERSLSLHLPARRVKQILKSPELLAPSAEKQEVSLLFTDIADWSTISDRLAPERLFKLLNRYFQETIPCVHKTDGMVLQLVGDAIFAIWNAPEPQLNHHERACKSALLLRDQLVQFESANESYPLHTRVGLHSGLASVGNVGSEDRLVYTALGAETNMAARLEGLNKYLGTEILASDRIVDACEDRFVWRNVGRFKLKGGDRVMEIYELISAPADAEASREWRKTFGKGLRHFHQAEWDEAEAAFVEVIGMRKKDGPSEFYRRRIKQLRGTTLPEKWFGEVSMDEK